MSVDRPTEETEESLETEESGVSDRDAYGLMDGEAELSEARS